MSFADAGSDPVFGEALLESFLAAAPACGPVVDQNVPTRQATVRFSVTAEDAASAGHSTLAIVRSVTAALGAATVRPTAIHVDTAHGSALQAA